MRNARWLGIFALAFITTFTSRECSAQSESLLRVGKAINVFIRYGYLSISMKVISYNDTERWIFKEPTRNVFQVRCRRWWRRRRRANESQSRIKMIFPPRSSLAVPPAGATTSGQELTLILLAGSDRAGVCRREPQGRLQRRLPHGVL